MKKTVDQEEIDFTAEGVPRRSRLTSGSRHGYDDVAENVRLDMGKFSFTQRKREHVRCLVSATELTVQGTHGAIAQKENAQLGPVKAKASQQLPEFCRDCRR